jgi:RimJ/RimL family protein N-acetyltransferase
MPLTGAHLPMREFVWLSCQHVAVANESVRNAAQRDIVLTTPRLVVTSWVAADVGPLHEVHSEPETMEFVRHGRPESWMEVGHLVDRCIAEHAARGWTKWRLADLDDRLVGRAGFGGSSESRGLSYLIRRSHRGRGLGTEVAEALVGWHLSNAVNVPLRALVAVGNDASARILEKIGFSEGGQEDFEGTICRVFAYPPTS